MNVGALRLIVCAVVTMMFGCSYSGTVFAQTGDDVIAAVDLHEEGYSSFRSNVTMVLEGASGKKRVRHLKISSVEIVPLGDHRKFVFEKPADIKGTAVLIHSKVVSDDSQWIFLPAFKRVKRISSNNKSTPFVGSEFSYEDLASQEREKYDNKWVGTEIIDGMFCDIVERRPLYQNSAYEKLLVYVDREHNRFRRVDYFAKGGGLVKSQVLEDYQIYQQRFHLPGLTTMVNHQNGKRTVMSWGDIRLKTNLPLSDFTVAALKRQR